MYFLTSDKLKLYYEIQQHPSSTKTIVLLNGLSQSVASWGLVTPLLKPHYNIVLLDFIFQGQSDKETTYRNFDQHATDVKELLDFLKLPDISIAGLSYGSLVAQHFALLFPDSLDKLILMGTFAHKTPYFDAISYSWQKALETGGYSLMFDVMLPSILSENYFRNPLIPIDLMRDARKEINLDSEALFKLMRATQERPDYREQLKQVKTPTLIIQGEKDLLLPVHLAEAVHKSIAGSRFEVIPHVGHTLNLEAVPQIAGFIRDFIRE